MVKIKVEKKMNLAELIQWAWDNPKLSKGKVFTSYKNDKDMFFKVAFNHAGNMSLSNSIGDCPTNNNLFSVTVEEEVTKYSEIPNLVELYDLETGKGPETLIHQNALVNNFIENEAVIALYAMNDDYTLTLLWTKDGGMVE